MNCRECEPLLVEVARRNAATEGESRLVGTATGDADLAAALEHAASCAQCAERLAEERALNTQLRSLAAAESRVPSAGCEATLMAAYRTERGREVHTRRWIFAVSGAMAASLVILLGAALVLSSESSSLVRAMASKFAPLAATNRTASSQAPSVTSSEAAEENDPNAEGQEEVTEFMAFYPGADVGSLDSGALVRVRMPSSALGSFGLPVTQGSEDQWVSADLLVDEDGAPQAIRFVRPAGQSARD